MADEDGPTPPKKQKKTEKKGQVWLDQYSTTYPALNKQYMYREKGTTVKDTYRG